MHVLQLLQDLRWDHAAGNDREAVGGLDDARAISLGAGAARGCRLFRRSRRHLLRRPGAEREFDDHRFDATDERELHLIAWLTGTDERAELLGIEKHLVVEARQHVAFLDLAHGRALGVDETDLDTNASGHLGVGRLDARAYVEAGVSDFIGGGDLGGGLFLVLGPERADEPREQEHVEGDLAEGVHGGSFVS